MFQKENQRLVRFLFRREKRRNIARRYQRMARSYHVTNTKDFAWNKASRKPYTRRAEVKSWRVHFKIILLGVLFCFTLAILLYHPFFHIKNITVTGLQRINQTEFTDAVGGIIQDNKLLSIFPMKNYFLVDVGEIRDILKDRFSLSFIRVSKVFPHSLTIEAEEKLSTVIYDNGAYYAYLGLDGHVVEQIRRVGEDEWTTVTQMVTTTNDLGEQVFEEKVIERYHTPRVQLIQSQAGDFPIVYDKTGLDKTGTVNEQVLESLFAQNVIDWFSLLTQETRVPFSYIVLDNPLGDARIMTNEGWEVRVQLSQETNLQFQSFIFLLKEKISSTKSLQYIDVRYEDRLYWQ